MPVYLARYHDGQGFLCSRRIDADTWEAAEGKASPGEDVHGELCKVVPFDETSEADTARASDEVARAMLLTPSTG